MRRDPSPTGRAIILTLVLTGRRWSEVLTSLVCDIEPGEPSFYRYRGKGGKRGRRELPRPAYEATERALATVNADERLLLALFLSHLGDVFWIGRRGVEPATLCLGSTACGGF